MLSICVPIYNFDVRPLVNTLKSQAKSLSVEIEIILIDDCSDLAFKELNRSVFDGLQSVELQINIGRAKIRNLFLNYAKFNYLLFLDCDALIKKENFLKTYVHKIKNTETKVICGGRLYDEVSPSKAQKLSWKYGVQKESQSVEVRKALPFDSFMTNNFVVAKSILVKIPFDESLAKYGHEDTLFGFYLKQNNIPILHIDNPVLNGDIEENNTFLQKTNQALENLSFILDKVEEDSEHFISSVKVLSFYFRLKRSFLLTLILFFAPFINSFFKLFLKIGWVNLTLFNYYKLSYLAKVMAQKKS